MIAGKFLKGAGMVTLFLFLFFIFSADFAAAQKEEDALLRARRLYQDGDYEGSIKLLSDFVSKLRAMVEQKKNVAEAFYLLAKIYYEVKEDNKVEENLRKCFETFPAFTKEDETDRGFKDRVNTIRKEVLEAKTKEPLPETETYEEEEPTAEEKVIEQPAFPKEKKKKKFPVLLVVGGIIVVGVVAALALGGKKKEEERFDIRGNWTIEPDIYLPIHMTFTGSLTSGEFLDVDENLRGTYTVNGRQVAFSYNTLAIHFTGGFVDRDHMQGNYEATGVNTGTWAAHRGFTSQITQNTTAVQSLCSNKN